MAELLVRVVDKVNRTSIYFDAKCTKRGDVISVKSDGSTWGVDEMVNPSYRIVRILGLSLETAESLLAPELPVNPHEASATLQARGHRLNVDHLDLGSDRRVTPIVVLSIDTETLEALAIKKAPIADPAIIGAPSHVIG